MGGRIAQLVALDHADTVRCLVLASSGASYKTKGGIPPAICIQMVKLGYERYIREHNIDIGFSKAYVEKHPQRVEECIKSLLASLPPIEIYFAQVDARQHHDTSARLKDIQVPTLVTVGDDEVHGLSDTTHVASAELLSRNIPSSNFSTVPGGGHFYFYSHPEIINRIVRDFIAGTER
jgi:pimeloyl-ACP methyl ester carboxylesterase